MGVRGVSCDEMPLLGQPSAVSMVAKPSEAAMFVSGLAVRWV